MLLRRYFYVREGSVTTDVAELSAPSVYGLASEVWTPFMSMVLSIRLPFPTEIGLASMYRMVFWCQLFLRHQGDLQGYGTRLSPHPRCG